MDTRIIYIKTILFLLWSLLLADCTPAEKKATIGDAVVTFRDSAQASKWIIRDDIDSFFNVVSKTDMAIQMKMSRIDISRDSMLSAYKIFLQKDVSDWQPEEIKAIQKLMQSAREMLDRIDPGLFPKEINLIKSKGQAYGNDVYFTRENSIVLPENIFTNWQPDLQLRILVHELYHIISRYNPEFRENTYKTIGFSRLSGTLEIPEFLQQKMLTNPDGIKADYAIELPDEEGQTHWFVPLLLSRYRSYVMGNGNYFDHLKMELFKITNDGNSQFTLVTDQSVFSSFTDNVLPAYQKKISSNTAYIIHPDEICADHFVLAVWKHENKKIPFLPPAMPSPAGDSIISNFLQVLKNRPGF